MRELRCRDLRFDCDGVVRANGEEGVLQRAAEHARDVHHVEQFPPEQVHEIRAQVRDGADGNPAARGA
ncbi:hypothetical protein DAERI_010030 [Deinococcus aerius]|uniref:DUF1059 domain-containing protein n=1 Tax=Deinococcus aerius TaxID=200253 RepID=A0A2I9DD66_9DEIO|nr:DUF1059 domain-containing protein [Deinococcus aerius]GBF03858.1 hypothetical protein DAERI_010030 [Deinococcus aerius]